MRLFPKVSFFWGLKRQSSCHSDSGEPHRPWQPAYVNSGYVSYKEKKFEHSSRQKISKKGNCLYFQVFTYYKKGIYLTLLAIKLFPKKGVLTFITIKTLPKKEVYISLCNQPFIKETGYIRKCHDPWEKCNLPKHCTTHGLWGTDFPWVMDCTMLYNPLVMDHPACFCDEGLIT